MNAAVWRADTPEHVLRRGYAQLAGHRRAAPATFEKAMDDPVWSRLVRLHAALLQRRDARRPATRRALDFKMLAAGEREDD